MFEFRNVKIETPVQITNIQSLGRLIGSIMGGSTTSVASEAVRIANLCGSSTLSMRRC
jgi:hypothetical protein